MQRYSAKNPFGKDSVNRILEEKGRLRRGHFRKSGPRATVSCPEAGDFRNYAQRPVRNGLLFLRLHHFLSRRPCGPVMRVALARTDRRSARCATRGHGRGSRRCCTTPRSPAPGSCRPRFAGGSAVSYRWRIRFWMSTSRTPKTDLCCWTAMYWPLHSRASRIRPMAAMGATLALETRSSSIARAIRPWPGRSARVRTTWQAQRALAGGVDGQATEARANCAARRCATDVRLPLRPAQRMGIFFYGDNLDWRLATSGRNPSVFSGTGV
jgi:hypothetical protein